MPIHHTPVTSSNIASIGYDPQTETLEVRFKGGRTASYSGVRAETHRALMSAESTGKAFNALIKPNLNFRYL